MPFPSPEELQLALGIHPSQQIASADPNLAFMTGEDQPPPPEEQPKQPDAKPTDTPETSEEAPRASMIHSPKPRGLDIPPVGTPGPVPNSVVTGVDAEGRPALGPAGSTGPVGSVPGASPDNDSITDLMTKPMRPISGDQAQAQQDQARETTDRAELDRLRSTGSGVDQFMHRHHILGPIVKGLSIAGSILSPGAAAAIPGTDLHHQVLVNRAEGNVQQDIGDEKAHSAIADHTEANLAREANTQGHLAAANAHFIAGSEHEDPNSPTGYTAQTVGGEWKPYTPAQSYKQTKGENSEAELKQRDARAKELNLTGEDLKFYRANGKLREPNPNQPAVDEDRKARLERQRQHDQEMQQQRYQSDHARWAEHKSAIEKDQEQEYAQVESAWRKKYGSESNNDVTDKKDTDPQKQAAMAELNANKKLVEDAAQARFKELGLEPQQPQFQAAAPETQPAATKEADTSDIPQPIASVRTGAPAPQTEKPAKPSPGTQQTPKPGSVIGPAPAGKAEGSTGKLADGTKVVIKNGQIVAQ